MAPLLLHAMSGGMVVTAPPPLPAALQATLLPPALTPRWRGAGVQVVVGVDWEGSGFEDEDLAAFRRFRDEFPQVPLTHFLNAAYYTKLEANDVVGAVEVTDKIRSVLRDGDEIGLHVHADNHLLHAAGVEPKRFPSWDPSGLPDVTGYSVPLSAFSEEEVRQVVAFSCRTLVQQGFERPRAFRAGGWHAGSGVLSALAAEGFATDSSEVPQDHLPGNFGEVQDLWPDATRVSQPYRLAQGLVEVPNNGCLADYVTAGQMVDTFREVVRSASPLLEEGEGGTCWYLPRAEGTPAVLSLGFHQETAAKFLPRLRAALREIERSADQQRIPLSYGRTKDVPSGALPPPPHVRWSGAHPTTEAPARRAVHRLRRWRTRTRT